MSKTKDVMIERPGISSIALEITGISPLLQNCFSQKTLEQLLRKHMGIATTREAKRPRDLIEQATVRNLEGRVCVPVMAIKKAMLSAAGLVKSYKKTQLRIAMFVEGQSIPITYTNMEPQMDMVRVGMNTPDIRFRPCFNGWKARVIIQFYDLYNASSVVDLLNRAGSSGLGEWRPEKDGTFGTFEVSRVITAKDEIAETRKECAVPLVRLRIPEWAMDVDLTDDIMKKIAGSNESHDPDPEAPHLRVEGNGLGQKGRRTEETT